MNTITALFRTEQKRPVPRERLELSPEQGIAGDDHAGPGDKQVVLADTAALAAIGTAETPGLCFRRFHANLSVAGLDRAQWPAGTRFSCGTAELEVTGFKHCFPECSLGGQNCPLTQCVLYARVLRAGTAAPGDALIALPDSKS